MKKIPSQIENPTGLHQRYVITKLVIEDKPLSFFQGEPSTGMLQLVERPVDRNSEYFVLRLDEGGSDINHIKACRIGVHAYADAIEPFIPELAKDLRERYPLLK